MPGCLCISIDLELAWGIWDKPSSDYHQRCADREAHIVEELLGIFERNQVGTTWAVVGRLLELDEARARSTEYGDAIWYAPQLVERIAGTPNQEIGSHSHAHVYFGETDRELLRADLAAARRAHERHGLSFQSFVFPRNQVNHLDLLREMGIRVFRSVDQGWFSSVRRRGGALAGRVANLVDKALPIPPRSVTPMRHPDGLVELPSSMLLFGRSGLRRVVHPAMLVAKAQLGLEAARRDGGVFHLWFHPSNFYHDTERQLDVLARIVARAARLRDRGQIEIRTMGSFAA
jgi:hypothetical protein